MCDPSHGAPKVGSARTMQRLSSYLGRGLARISLSLSSIMTA